MVESRVTGRLLAIVVAVGLIAAEAGLYLLAGKIGESVRGTVSLILLALISVTILVAMMLFVARR